MYDLDWIRQQFKPADRTKPMTIVEGLQGTSRHELLEQRGSHANIQIIQVVMFKYTICIHVHIVDVTI